jgi:hypothetical protein
MLPSFRGTRVDILNGERLGFISDWLAEHFDDRCMKSFCDDWGECICPPTDWGIRRREYELLSASARGGANGRPEKGTGIILCRFPCFYEKYYSDAKAESGDEDDDFDNVTKAKLIYLADWYIVRPIDAYNRKIYDNFVYHKTELNLKYNIKSWFAE